jgi:hypothetical protein
MRILLFLYLFCVEYLCNMYYAVLISYQIDNIPYKYTLNHGTVYYKIQHLDWLLNQRQLGFTTW